jgi:hypothetical protein
MRIKPHVASNFLAVGKATSWAKAKSLLTRVLVATNCRPERDYQARLPVFKIC